jgi:hypothetical protein
LPLFRDELQIWHVKSYIWYNHLKIRTLNETFIEKFKGNMETKLNEKPKEQISNTASKTGTATVPTSLSLQEKRLFASA